LIYSYASPFRSAFIVHQESLPRPNAGECAGLMINAFRHTRVQL